MALSISSSSSDENVMDSSMRRRMWFLGRVGAGCVPDKSDELL
eukprot:CAMPEP_0185779656 /NCGR_PEP_ID=MMETSP1174-20130828/96520_1 /TAXON_ID=35687 /ORGANISM="Dictyocha speculum, Strain CCMP1381" /LENGTH=42 /DNA_ID= /DNA_START= /DNA_END= /DNA_ORIENTATION=